MPIYLYSGKPGAGKSLLAVRDLVKRFSDERDSNGKLRPIYTNINGFFIPDRQVLGLVDPLKWYELPENSVIVFDECQRQFPPRNGGKPVPRAIREMNTHRHHGFDLLLITQHPRNIDREIFSLVDQHFHLHRAFGMGSSKLFKWEGVNENPEPLQSRSNAQKARFRFPKKLFQYYVSSSEHNIKVRVPWKILGILAVALSVVVGGIFYMKSYFSRYDDPEKLAELTGSTGIDSESGSSSCGVLVGSVRGRLLFSQSGFTVKLPESYVASAFGGSIVNAQGQEVLRICQKNQIGTDNPAGVSET